MSTHMTKKPRQNRLDQYSTFIDLIPAEEIQQVFDHWVSTFPTNKGKQPILSKPRTAHIAWALHTFGLDLCLQAIDGCAKSEWHMGGNPGEKIYNEITLIFRDIPHTKRFIQINRNT
ncbi:MAG: hypothetical protein EBT80_00670 [Chitinophagales bacterium]|nr:hypothetical protein [Chitinophagales bacterium]